VAAHQQHQIRRLLGIEGGPPLGPILGLLREFYRLGRALHDPDVVRIPNGVGGFLGRKSPNPP